VSPENGYHHILTVVPYVGTGKPGDPKRPMYAPAVRANVNSRSDILAFVQLPSDDGKFALVEFVAADRNAFQQIMADKSLTVFEKGKHTKAEVEAAMQKHRKGFVLDNFGAVVR
jgi:hypothetical protein